MKSYIDITGKYLRVQKKRSVLTVLGIVLSVALLTGIGTIFTSLFDSNLRITIRNNGSYHAAITGVPGDKTGMFSQNLQTESAGFGRNLGFAAYAANQRNDVDLPYKYLEVKELDGNAIALLPYELQGGRMPTAQGEIALDYWTLKYLPGAKLGGAVTLDIGTRTLPDGTVITDTKTSDPNEIFTKSETRQFTIVGLLKPQYITGLNFAQAVVGLDSTNLSASAKITAYVKLKTVTDVQKRIQAMADAAGLSTGKGQGSAIQYNDRVLRLFAQSINQLYNSSFLMIMGTIIALVVLSTIAVIYNSFNISVVERVSQFGLLRCVGATPAQIRKIVFHEAAILGVIGIPIGVACGTVAMGIVFSIVTAVAPNLILGGMRLVVSPELVLAGIVIGAITIYLSALLPARKAAKISPMEAVRGTGAFKKEKFRKSDRHRIVLKLLGAEGWMAWKNLGRNRKRFYITVLSMVISIVLFIVFSSLVGYAYQSGTVDMGENPSYALSAKRTNLSVNITEAELQALKKLPGVDYYAKFGQSTVSISLPRAKLEDKLADNMKRLAIWNTGNSNIDLLNCILVTYGDVANAAVMRSLALSDSQATAFAAGDGVILVNQGYIVDDKHNQKRIRLAKLKPGETITMKAIFGPEGSLVTKYGDAKIIAVVDKGMAGATYGQNGCPILIVSDKLFLDYADKQGYPNSLIVMLKSGTSNKDVKAYMNSLADRYPNLNLMDLEDATMSYKQSMTVISIFLYGFVAVISLIGCLNIINTISTNIIIRTRELSILRAIGMSYGSVRKMVAWESILHGAAAALIGSVAGTSLSWLVYNSITAIRSFPWTLPWQQVLVAVGAAALVAVVSAMVPLKRINNSVIVEGIRGEE